MKAKTMQKELWVTGKITNQVFLFLASELNKCVLV